MFRKFEFSLSMFRGHLIFCRDFRDQQMDADNITRFFVAPAWHWPVLSSVQLLALPLLPGRPNIFWATRQHAGARYPKRNVQSASSRKMRLIFNSAARCIDTALLESPKQASPNPPLTSSMPFNLKR